MISPILQAKFNIIEMAVFPEWKKANDQEKERICRELGEMEAKMIIDDIEKQAVLPLDKTK